MTEEKLDINYIFGKDGLLKKALPNYENRPEQILMAESIQKTIENKEILIVEAGTGVGKSLAYLIPFIYWSVEEKKKVIVSTYTKTLQEQLTKKDLPFLQEILPLNFDFSLCVGSENYICLRRYNQVLQQSFFETKDEKLQLSRISEWKKNTKSGLKLELDFEPNNKLWLEICRDPELCLGKKCSYHSECFYTKARIKQNKANILVVNHALFFANIASRGRALPQYDAIVFDEAHNIEEVASEYLGIEISNTGIKFLLDRIYSPKTGKGLISRIKKLDDEIVTNMINTVNDVRLTSENFFSSILDKFGSESLAKRIHQPNIIENLMEVPLLNLYQVLKLATTEIEDEETFHEVNAYANKILTLYNGIKTFIEQTEEEYVYWLEIVPKTKHIRVVLHVTPVDISNYLRELVFNKTSPIVLTSATLSVNKSFDFIKSRLGIDKCNEVLLDSPFDYKNQVLIYIPEEMPDPSYENEDFLKAGKQKIKEIVEITKGRTFILFTSYETLNQTNNFLTEEIDEIEVLKQGDLPRWQMIEEFKSGPNIVLLGTDTFWQGVDIPGRALECVIIFKLPFSVPDDPVTEAKMEYLAMQNKDPFIHYQIPQAIIMLKQGFGRLIRTKTDKGVVAILDPRIKTRYYGRWFIESLPDCRITYSISDIEKFFENARKI
ncbi:MAG: ATP-dependent DNA helicase [Endomicrobiia bacterium]